MTGPKHEPADQPARPADDAEHRPQETQPAEEWGSRQSQATGIARGGKEHGPVEGATEQKP